MCVIGIFGFLVSFFREGEGVFFLDLVIEGVVLVLFFSIVVCGRVWVIFFIVLVFDSLEVLVVFIFLGEFFFLGLVFVYLDNDFLEMFVGILCFLSLFWLVFLFL